MKIIFFVLLSSVISAAVGFVVAHSMLMNQAAIEAVNVIDDSINNWGDWVTLERTNVNGSSMCKSFDPQTGNSVGPWSMSNDGRCHMRDEIRNRIIKMMAK